MEIEKHPFPPFIPDEPRALVMGTFPPQPKRWAMDFYYPNRNNDFWKVCGIIFYSNPLRLYNPDTKQYDLPEIQAMLRRYHIAMSDTGVEAVRLAGNASDKFLDIRKPIDIDHFLNTYPTLQYLVTTGEKAAQIIAELTHTEPPKMGEYTEFEYESQPGTVRKVRHYRMPSTSRAYPLALEKKAALYARVFDLLK